MILIQFFGVGKDRKWKVKKLKSPFQEYLLRMIYKLGFHNHPFKLNYNYNRIDTFILLW